MSGISKSQVSRLREEIDQRVKAFLDRPIEGDWPCGGSFEQADSRSGQGRRIRPDAASCYRALTGWIRCHEHVPRDEHAFPFEAGGGRDKQLTSASDPRRAATAPHISLSAAVVRFHDVAGYADARAQASERSHWTGIQLADLGLNQVHAVISPAMSVSAPASGIATVLFCTRTDRIRPPVRTWAIAKPPLASTRNALSIARWPIALNDTLPPSEDSSISTRMPSCAPAGSNIKATIRAFVAPSHKKLMTTSSLCGVP